MATMMNNNAPELMARTTIQKVVIGMGIFFVVIGMAGIIMPGMMGMHLSLAHNLIHLASGALALWCGYADDPKRAQNFAVGFGIFYGLMAIAGFVMGRPGFPGVGYMEADQRLLRVIPNALEFGTMDHAIHILISAVLITSAIFYKRKSDVHGRTLETRMGMGRTTTDLSNFDRNLKDMDLGESDVQRSSDYNRRDDFERRV